MPCQRSHRRAADQALPPPTHGDMVAQVDHDPAARWITTWPPPKHPDGRFSVPGAAARFGVSEGIVRRWLQRGLVTATRADFGTHRDAYWLEIDDATAARLKARLRIRRPAGRA